jgi:hypothetical protein
MSDYVKGEKPRDLDAAKGGAALGRSRSFLKESDGEDQSYASLKPYQNPDAKLQDYGKDSAYGKSGADTMYKGKGVQPVACKEEGETKVLKTVMPRK